MIASIVISTFNKSKHLRRTLNSIVSQHVPFDYEIIVVDDGSSDDTSQVCKEFPVKYVYLDRPGYLNPGPARNVGYRIAKGEIIINQSDDVEHRTPNNIELLVNAISPDTCVLAHVTMVHEDGKFIKKCTGSNHRRLLFFLGAVWKKDLYYVGGNDEDFVEPGYEDRWLSYCLLNIPRTFIFRDDIIGWHIFHEEYEPRNINKSKRIFRHKLRSAYRGNHPWTARTGGWV